MLEQQLTERLADNLKSYVTNMPGYDEADVSSIKKTYAYLISEHMFSEPDINFLLKFQNPLKVIDDRWGGMLDEIELTNGSLFCDYDWILDNNDGQDPLV